MRRSSEFATNLEQTGAPALNRPSPDCPSIERSKRRFGSLLWFPTALLLLGTGGVLVGVALASLATTGRAWPHNHWLLPGTAALLVLLAGELFQRHERDLGDHTRQLVQDEQIRTREVQEHYNRLISLYGVGTGFVLDRVPEIQYDKIVRTCFDLFDSDRVSLLLLDRFSGELCVCAAIGPPDLSLIVGRRQRADEGIAGRVLQEGRPLLIGPDSPLLRNAAPRKTPGRPRFAMVTPIAAPGHTRGVLCLSSQVEVDYSEQDLRELQLFASNIGVYLKLLEDAA